MGSMTSPVIAGLAVGIAFIILFAVFVPAMSTSPRINSGIESGMNMPASYFLNDCDFPLKSTTAVAFGNIKEIKERNWISVVKVDRTLGLGSGTEAPCTIMTSELASKIPALTTAIRGANGCLDGTEVCQVSHGISRGGDEADYELTITKEEAANILKEVRLGQYNAAMLASGDSFYTMWFHSTDEAQDAQIESWFLEPSPSHVPVSLAVGQSINYTLLVKTWATYGGSVNVDLFAAASARDSGLLVEFEPATLEIPERSEAEAVLKITASPDARHGTYDINIGGIPSNPCGFSCPAVIVGNNSWHIQTFGSDRQMGQGGPGEIPDWLWLDLATDKEVYSTGEPIEIKAYLVNDGSASVILDREARRLMTMIHGPTGPVATPVYGIDSYDFDAKDTMIIEPKSKTLLVRSFMWDQKTMMSGVEPHQVPAGTFNIVVSFSGYSNAVLSAQHKVTISDSTGDE